MDEYPSNPIWTDPIFSSTEFLDFKKRLNTVVEKERQEITNPTVKSILPELHNFVNEGVKIQRDLTTAANLELERNMEKGMQQIMQEIKALNQAHQDSLSKMEAHTKKSKNMKFTIVLDDSSSNGEAASIKEVTMEPVQSPPKPLRSRELLLCPSGEISSSKALNDVNDEMDIADRSSFSANAGNVRTMTITASDESTSSPVTTKSTSKVNSKSKRSSSKAEKVDEKCPFYPYKMVSHVTVSSLMREWSMGFPMDTVIRPPLMKLVQEYKIKNIFGDDSARKSYNRRLHIIHMIEDLVKKGKFASINLAAQAVDDLISTEDRSVTLYKLDEIIKEINSDTSAQATLDNLRARLKKT
jgi:hypothetical protein